MQMSFRTGGNQNVKRTPWSVGGNTPTWAPSPNEGRFLFSCCSWLPFLQGRTPKSSDIHPDSLILGRDSSDSFYVQLASSFPQTTCGSLSLSFIKSITYAVLIRVCKSNIKIIPWGNPDVQLCHFMFPFATLTRQGRLKPELGITYLKPQSYTQRLWIKIAHSPL